jgi:hypothetical protein
MSQRFEYYFPTLQLLIYTQITIYYYYTFTLIVVTIDGIWIGNRV